jgi:hypothetical protein
LTKGGGGGNRTRVRGRTGQNVYKLRLPFDLARRPECSRPTAGPAILWSHASGDWLSFGASPFLTPLPEPRAELGATRYLTGLGGECEVVVRTCVVSRLF